MLIFQKEHHEISHLLGNTVSHPGHKHGLTGNPKRTGGIGTLEVEVVNTFKMLLGTGVYNKKKMLRDGDFSFPCIEF